MQTVLHALHKQLTHATAVLVTRAHSVQQCKQCTVRQCVHVSQGLLWLLMQGMQD